MKENTPKGYLLKYYKTVVFFIVNRCFRANVFKKEGKIIKSLRLKFVKVYATMLIMVWIP